MFRFAAIFVLLLGASSALADDVLVVEGSDSLDKIVKENDFVVLELYAPWLVSLHPLQTAILILQYKHGINMASNLRPVLHFLVNGTPSFAGAYFHRFSVRSLSIPQTSFLFLIAGADTARCEYDAQPYTVPFQFLVSLEERMSKRVGFGCQDA